MAGLGALRSARSPSAPGGVPPACENPVDVPVRRSKSEVESDRSQVSPTGVSAWSGMTSGMVRDDHDKRRGTRQPRRPQTRQVGGVTSEAAITTTRASPSGGDRRRGRDRLRLNQIALQRVEGLTSVLWLASNQRAAPLSQDSVPHHRVGPRKDDPQHRRPRPERVETSCTDWHLPPMAKGASPRPPRPEWIARR